MKFEPWCPPHTPKHFLTKAITQKPKIYCTPQEKSKWWYV